ncbi:synaptotagmin-A-like isoform X2 [Antedon mediterranea]|uniref:synaptotagmin-A-like isoform X2 n=1 Tax=Antedon mediterranea TaxID=105859 RepID=UPI003AF7F9E3
MGDGMEDFNMIEISELSDTAKIGLIVGSAILLILVLLLLFCISCCIYRKYKRRDVVNPNYVKVKGRAHSERTYQYYGGEAYGSFGQALTLSETQERRANSTMYDSKESILSEQLEEMQFLPPQNGSPEDTELGKLEISLGYQENTGLIITIHQVYDLPMKNYGGSTDPFVKFTLQKISGNLPSFSFQTTIKHRTLQPVFEESFDASIHPMEIQLYRLKCYVCEHDKFTKPTVVGEIELNLEEIDFTASYRNILQLKPSVKSYFGEMCISLCYLVTSNRLIVGILRATNLQPLSTLQCDTCVRVTLILGSRKLKRRRTQIRENDLNPEFDELMYFEVPPDKLDKVKFLVVVTNSKRAVDENSDDVTSDELGRVMIGRKCSALSYEHWSEVMRYPRRPFAQWYNLLE